MTINNTSRLKDINVKINNLIDNENILSYGYRINNYCTNRDIVEYILSNPDDVKFRLNNDKYMLFAVTTVNNKKIIIPCFLYKEYTPNVYTLVHIPENLFHNMYDVNSKYIDFAFDTPSKDISFEVMDDMSDDCVSLNGKIKMDQIDLDIELFSSYKDADAYLKALVTKLHLEDEIAKERHANNIWTVDEIAKKLGISVTDLKICDENTTYYNGSCPECYGELDTDYNY